MKRYVIGIDLGGTSVKYALIDEEGTFCFEGKLASRADVSANAVMEQLVKAITVANSKVFNETGIATMHTARVSPTTMACMLTETPGRTTAYWLTA